MRKIEKVLRITKADFLHTLSNFNKKISATGVAFGSVVYFVDESGSKTVDKKKVLQKLVRVNLTLGASYENRVNRDLAKRELEDNFTAQSMSGKEYINDEGIIAIDTKTRTKHYLIATVENHAIPDTIYFFEGKRINKDKAIEQNLFMPSYFTPKTTSGRGNMSEAKDFHTISPNLDNVISLTLNRIKFIIED